MHCSFKNSKTSPVHIGNINDIETLSSLTYAYFNHISQNTEHAVICKCGAGPYDNEPVGVS